MAVTFLNMMRIIFESCSSWLEDLFAANGMYTIFLGSIGIVLIVRFILMPLFRGGVTAGSDKVSARSGSNEVSNSPASDEVTR